MSEYLSEAGLHGHLYRADPQTGGGVLMLPHSVGVQSEIQREAQALLRRIADGTWQPRFQGLQTQARQQLQGS